MTAMTNKRLDPKDRTEQLLEVALQLAARHGLATITRNQIAEDAGVAPSLVSARLGTMDDMRRSVMRRAIKTETLPVIAAGLLAKDRYALRAPEDLRQRAIASISA